MTTLPAIQIPPLDESARDAARARQNTLTKPPGSLGHLEDIACHLAAIQSTDRPTIDRKAIVVVAADHGVAANGVSAYPPEVTPQMVANFLAGGAAINILAKTVNARVMVVDAGVATDIPGPTESLRRLSLGPGTADFTTGPAMPPETAAQGIANGLSLANELIDEGTDTLIPGDMGIGNSTAAAAITAVITDSSISDVTGRGTGVDDEGVTRKIAAIEKAITVNNPDPTDALDVLAKLGGFEIAVMAGLILGAASRKTAIVLDGFIATSAALIAHAANPHVTDYIISGHQSAEGGHPIALAHLGLTPLLDLNMRLGEGTGAALALSLIDAAVNLHNNMATFEEAAVSSAVDEP